MLTCKHFWPIFHYITNFPFCSFWNVLGQKKRNILKISKHPTHCRFISIFLGPEGHLYLLLLLALSLASLMSNFRGNLQLISISLINCHQLLIKALNEITNVTWASSEIKSQFGCHCCLRSYCAVHFENWPTSFTANTHILNI